MCMDRLVYIASVVMGPASVYIESIIVMDGVSIYPPLWALSKGFLKPVLWSWTDIYVAINMGIGRCAYIASIMGMSIGVSVATIMCLGRGSV